MKKLAVVTGAVLCGFAASADIWYVHADRKGSTGDGRTEETAFPTIQEAVDAAATEDTIRVLPGVYADGETWDGYMNARVVITNKALTIESTGGRDVTHIVGKRPTSGNIGEGAVRCIFAIGGAGTRFRGFTIRDGATRVNESTYRGVGAGLCAGSADANVYLIDCVVSNCQARGGAALQGGGAIRTLIVGNRTYGSSNGTIGRNASLYNCLCVNNVLCGQPGVQQGNAVNCTFVGNGTGSLFSEKCRVRNCLTVLNAANLSEAGASLRDVRHTVASAPADFGSSERGTDGLVTDASERQMLAPAFEDFRPMAGSVAATNGLADIVLADTGGLSVPEDEIYYDYFGTPYPKTGTIACGAIQTCAPAVTCGAVKFGSGTFATFGCVDAGGCGTYAYPTSYPAFLHLTADRFPSVAGGVFAYTVSGDMRPPEMDESFYVLPPPAADVTVGAIAATEVIYVDRDSAAAEQTGGKTTPYKTIRQATDAVSTDASAYSIIRVASGTYDDAAEGSTTANGLATRVVVAKGHAVRLVGAGRGKTFLVGAPDPNPTSSSYPGCGPNAVRCVAAVNDIPTFVQGFTLADGHADAANTTAGTGGGAYMANAYCHVADCTITNCVAYRAIVMFGNCLRCDFHDCYGYNGGLRNMRSVVSCSFVGTPGSGLGAVIYPDSSLKAVCNCSGTGPSTGSSVWAGGTYPTWNSAFHTGASVTEMPTAHRGCLVWNYSTMPSDASYVKQDPAFVSTTDVRTFAVSPVWTSGCVPTEENGGATYAYYASSDLMGRPFVLSDEDCLPSGCHAHPAVKVEIATPPLGTVAPSGVLALEPGESVTVTYAKDPEHADTRPYFGLAVNGETVTFGLSWTLTATESDRIAPLCVTALASTNWYVNANTDPSQGVVGNDENDGFTPDTPKRTLAGAMSGDLLSGDCVHAAEGSYADGQMYDACGSTSATGITSNRVVIADGITLAGDAGAEKTFIVGRSGVGTTRCGAGALRCALLRGSATLRGFTVLNGNTADGTSGSINADSNGGGILCEGASATVFGCVVSNCTAAKGGGVFNGTLVNCRLVDNGGRNVSWGDAARNAALYGCYIGPQRGSNGVHSPGGSGSVENCTFDGVTLYGVTSRPFRNCLFRNPESKSSLTISLNDLAKKPSFDTCLFDEENGATWTNNVKAMSFVGCGTAPLAQLQLDADGRPVYGACAAIDRGKDSLLSAKLGGLDAGCGQRIYNGCSDVGAFECDYRPVFARQLGANVSVTAASPSVTLTDGAVRLVDGTSLLVRWPTPVDRHVRFTASASGGGAISIVQNGTIVAMASDETRCVRLRTTGCEDLVFSYAGTGAADLMDFRGPLGLCIVIR